MVVAPPCSHQNGDACDIDSFRTRAWCRAEVMSCWAMRGAECMYLSAGEGLGPRARAAHFRAPALDDAELPAPAAAEPELALDAGRGLPAHALAVDGG